MRRSANCKTGQTMERSVSSVSEAPVTGVVPPWATPVRSARGLWPRVLERKSDIEIPTKGPGRSHVKNLLVREGRALRQMGILGTERAMRLLVGQVNRSPKGRHPEEKADYFWTLSNSALDPP